MVLFEMLNMAYEFFQLHVMDSGEVRRAVIVDTRNFQLHVMDSMIGANAVTSYSTVTFNSM